MRPYGFAFGGQFRINENMGKQNEKNIGCRRRIADVYDFE